MLFWGAENADGCIAGGSWSGLREPYGVEILYDLTTAQTLELTCANALGSVTETVQIQVSEVEPVSVDFEVSHSFVSKGASVELSWSATNATECNAIGGTGDRTWYGSQPVNGSAVIPSVSSGHRLRDFLF